MIDTHWIEIRHQMALRGYYVRLDGLVGVTEYMYTWGLITHVDKTGCRHRFCYPKKSIGLEDVVEVAKESFDLRQIATVADEWDDLDVLPMAGWVKYKGLLDRTPDMLDEALWSRVRELDKEKGYG